MFGGPHTSFSAPPYDAFRPFSGSTARASPLTALPPPPGRHFGSFWGQGGSKWIISARGPAPQTERRDAGVGGQGALAFTPEAQGDSKKALICILDKNTATCHSQVYASNNVTHMQSTPRQSISTPPRLDVTLIKIIYPQTPNSLQSWMTIRSIPGMIHF